MTITDRIGATCRALIVFLLRAYRLIVSPLLGNNCRFYPSCSCYTETAISRYGVFKGSWLGLRRLGKCHPWHEGGLDPVPGCNNPTSTEH